MKWVMHLQAEATYTAQADSKPVLDYYGTSTEEVGHGNPLCQGKFLQHCL